MTILAMYKTLLSSLGYLKASDSLDLLYEQATGFNQLALTKRNRNALTCIVSNENFQRMIMLLPGILE